MKTSEFLILSKEKINTPDKWFKGEWAVNKDGFPVRSYSNDAVCFCSAGALNRTQHRLVENDGPWNEDKVSRLADMAAFYLRKVCFNLHGINFINFNDRESTTHEEMMNVWDKAIELAKEKENDV